jgi:hypothetical protein
MKYFIHNIWCILFTIYDVLHSQYMMYFIHNIWCILFTIYYVFYSQYMMYFLHNIWSILFTKYYVFHSQYMMYFLHNILRISFTILWIKYVINVAVYLLLFYIFWTTVSVLVMTCLAVPQLLAYTRKQTDRRENLIYVVFQTFFSNFLRNETTDFLTR